MDIERANTNSIFRTSDIFDDGIAIDPVAARTAGLLDVEVSGKICTF
jgi:hypothetical protein